MNRKQFTLVLLALAIVGTAGIVLLKRDQRSWTTHEPGMGDKVLPNFRFNDVAAIHVRSAASDFNLARHDAIWVVRERGDYPANYQQIKDLLLKIKDLKVVRSESVGPSQLGRVDLEEPGKQSGGGTLLEFKDARGQLLDSLVVGKRHIRPQTESDPFRLHGLFDGCYVLTPRNPGNVLFISDDLACAAPESQAWLSREFFKLENIKSVSLVATNGANRWTILRGNEAEPWTLTDLKPDDGENLDPDSVSQIGEVLGLLTFVDVIPKATPPSAETPGVRSTAFWPPGTGLDKPMIALVETFEHLFHTLKIGGRDSKGNYHLAIGIRADLSANPEAQDQAKKVTDKVARESRLAASGWVYLVESHLIEPLIRERAQLLRKKTIAGAQNPATKPAPPAFAQ
jgi:hypothetical protein